MPIDCKLYLIKEFIMEIDMLENASVGTIIKVVGVGGAGGNAVQHMINKGVSGVEFIVANTDAQALKMSKADNVIQIGDTGLGAGMQPAVGRQLAEESTARVEDALRGAHMVFIAAGMGGGTGTGAAPVIAQIAKRQGALTVAVVSKPFSYEGQKCMDIADQGLEELAQHVDSLIIILNEKLEEIYEDDSMIEWLGHADDVLNNTSLDGDVGSDATSAQDRANAAGFRGVVSETVAINPALAINNLEVINQWYYRPDYMAIMSNCANNQIGVWSVNSLDRSVVVAVYGQPG